MDRRSFVKGLAVAGAAAKAGADVVFASKGPRSSIQISGADDITASRLPRWRGFNLQGRFAMPGRPYSGRAFDEFDFATMAEWGFDFARLPLSYWAWGSTDNWFVVREEPLKEIDRSIDLGTQYRIHINLNFHRIPGYCINEPPKMRSYEGYLEERYVEIVNALVGAIRHEDPNRLIFADGMNIGQAPVLGIINLGLVQSTRGYLPKAVSHYTATWVPKDEFESFALPTWPLKDDQGKVWDRNRLKAEYIDKYKPLIDKGVQIHVGEWGVFNKTPHDVALAWMEDCLSLWKEAGWGSSMWNLRGSFGVMNSERQDVQYEDFKGQKLDRKMLELLKRY